MSNPIDKFFRELDRFIRDIQREFAEELSEFLKWFVIQAVVSALVNVYFSPLGFLVNVAFLIYTFFGFYQEIGQVAWAYERRKVIRFLLAVFALLVDIWLNLTIH